MNKKLGYGLVGLLGLSVAGCPVYPRDQYCYDSSDCPANSYCNADNVCMNVPTGSGTGGGGMGGSAGSSQACTTPDACGANAVCGKDGRCHSGDCSFSGCVSGYDCVLNENKVYSCRKTGPGADGGAGAAGSEAGVSDASQEGSNDGGIESGSEGGGFDGSADGAAEASKAVYCGHPGDCDAGQVCAPDFTCQNGSCTALGCANGYVCSGVGVDAVCVPANPAACIVDGDCKTAGNKCINGICTGPADLCTDKTQCPGGDQDKANCVDGKCAKSCSPNPDAGKSCDYGYTCDNTRGVCVVPSPSCTRTADCGDISLVCVGNACVPRCLKGNVCGAGTVCVANGCAPDQKPVFGCTVDGQRDSCAASSVCLHHSCYISCADPNPLACDNNPPALSVCKTVTTPSGPHKVCGSNQNLGSECDPTSGQGCTPGKICIDGFCR